MPLLRFDKDATAELPDEPGVYIFLGQRSEILYVGKAQSLRHRVRSYFSDRQEFRPVTALLPRHARQIDYIVTDSEKAALLLENSMIKKHAPRFNVRLRDDKTYFSLKLDLNVPWPWLQIVRKRKHADGVLYFGPFTSALSCRRMLRFIGRLFPLRTCTDAVLNNRVRPCLSYEINQCIGPCVGLTDKVAYRRVVDDAVRFLRGKTDGILTGLRRDMAAASDALDYERAALLRDRISAISETVAQTVITGKSGGVFDVIGICCAPEGAALVLMMVRDGVLSSSLEFFFDQTHGPEDLIRSFLGQFYGEGRPVPPEVLLPEDVADLRLLSDVLSEIRMSHVRLAVPQRGEKRRLLNLAERNAAFAWDQRLQKSDESRAVLENLQRKLGLVRLPRRMECFDISNLMGTHVVASCVSFRDGRPSKENYRRFKIRTVDGQDDFASMAEVLRRRLTRGLAEDDLPDLIVIDGGRGQLGVVVNVMSELSISTIDVIGLAKARNRPLSPGSSQEFERVFKPGEGTPIILPQVSPEQHLLTRIRDEAHRFAITYHRRLKSKTEVTSLLEQIPGIGPQRSRSLLREFGSIAGVREATDETLCAVKGMTQGIVEQLRVFFAEGGHLPSGQSDSDDPINQPPSTSE